MDERIIIAAMAPLVVLLSFIKSLERLAYLSLLANVLCFAGLIVTFQYLGRCLQDPATFPKFAGASKLPLFFGTAIFAFEGIGVVRNVFRCIIPAHVFHPFLNEQFFS